MTPPDPTSPTPLQLAALALLRDEPGHYPSSLAYTLLDRGVLRRRHPARRLRAQGAGFIGGKILGELFRAGWITRQIGSDTRWETTARGQRVLVDHEDRPDEHA